MPCANAHNKAMHNYQWLMPRRLVLICIGALLALSGCSRDIPLSLPAGEPVSVTQLETPPNYALSAGSDPYLKLKGWVEANRSGWSPYLTTPPAKGIIVRSANLDLQFVESIVLARTRDGVFSKSLNPAEYAFLRR
jgi:hypothetical protein